ncbi:tape measure protein [Holdemanella porci]|uniref:tape measure protein n=1 Tax=Holdemanella porci TaxID=2652276 RepID=UPI0029430903|nr:tape measure protein [Holdemanella porci]
MSVREVGARLVLDIKDAKARLNELERQIKAIEKAKIQFAANTAELDRLENRLKEIKKERDSLMKQRLAMQVDLDNLANLRNKLADIKEDISNLKKELYSLNNKKLAIDIELKQNANDIQDVLNDKTLSEGKRDDLLKGLYSVREKLKYELNEIGIEIDKLQQKINNFNKEKIKVEADISSLKDAEKLANEFDNTIADLDKEEIDINAKTDKLENANKQLGDMISKEGEVNNTTADVKSQIIGFEDSMNKLNRLQQAAKALKSASKITFDVGNKMSNLGSSMLNIAKNFQNNPIGDIGRFLVQGVGYSSLYRLVSGAQNAMGEAFSNGVKRYDTIKVAKRTLSTVVGDVDDSTTKIQKMIDNLDESILGLPTTLDDALSHVTRFTSINHDLDRSQKLFSAINDSILTFGGDSEGVNNAVTQYSQIMGSKMDARTLRSMEDAGMTPALTAIAKKFNMSFAEFREAFTGSNPTISLQQFEDALIELDEKGGGGLNSLATMVKSSVATISNGLDLIPKRFSKAEEKWLGALDEVSTELTGATIYGNIYKLSQKVEGLGDIGANFIRSHKKEIGEGIDFIKTKFSELLSVLKTFSFKDFVGGFKQGLDDFKGAIDFFKPLVSGLYNFAKDKITEMGDGSFSKGLGRFVSDYIQIGIGLKYAGKLMKLGSGGISLLGDLVNVSSKFKGKSFNIPFLGKLGSKFSSIKDAFKSSDEITTAVGTPKTFDVEGFKNKLSSLAIIAGGAGTIILYCKAIKEIEKNVPNDITTLPMRLTNLFSVMGLMMGANTLNAAVSKVLEMNNALTGLAMMIGQGGALWLFAKAMQELDKTMPDGFDTFNDKLLGLFECIGSMTLITGIQGGAGVLTGGITTLAQVLGMVTTTGLAGTLIACAKAMQEVDKNVPSNTKGLKKKIQGIMDVIDMFEGGGTYSSWWSQVIKSSESLWKNMETWNITRILKKLVTIGESISKVQGMSIDSSSFNDQFKDIQEVIKNINDFEFPTVSTSSATNIADANSIVKNYTTMASSLSKMSSINGSSINVENCTSILKNVASVVSEMKKIVFHDVTKNIKFNLNATNAQEFLDTLKILEQIVPEFGNLQATITNNPLPNAEDIKKTITSISQAIGYISVAGVGTGKDKNMLSYNLKQMPDSKLFNNALKAITTLGDIILKFGTLNVYSTDFDFETLRANIKSIGNAVNEMATNKGLTENLENMDTVNKTVSKLKKTCESLNSIVGLNLDFVKVGEVTTGIQTFLNNVKGLKVGEATTDVVTEVNSIVTSFHNMATTLSNMKSEFNTSGTDMANGIIEGFKSIDIEGSFGTKIDNAKASLKKKSFKSVGKKFGKDVVSGFSEGISNMSNSISNQITMMYGYSTRFTDLGKYLGSAFKNAFNNQSGNINTGGTTTPTVNRGNESIGNNMKFAKGGPVYLKRGGQPVVMKPSGTDTVPAMLTPGEYVMKRSAVKNAGQSFMDKVNNMDLKGAFKELSTRYGSHVGNVVNKNVTINNNDNRVTNNSIAFNEGNERRQAIKVGRCLRGLA